MKKVLTNAARSGIIYKLSPRGDAASTLIIEQCKKTAYAK